jgi:hypothetical protein
MWSLFMDLDFCFYAEGPLAIGPESQLQFDDWYRQGEKIQIMTSPSRKIPEDIFESQLPIGQDVGLISSFLQLQVIDPD